MNLKEIRKQSMYIVENEASGKKVIMHNTFVTTQLRNKKKKGEIT